jgi:hypothetical protein
VEIKHKRMSFFSFLDETFWRRSLRDPSNKYRVQFCGNMPLKRQKEENLLVEENLHLNSLFSRGIMSAPICRDHLTRAHALRVEQLL